MQQKFYVVIVGRNKGIYHSWKECEKQIKGFKGAIYKSFVNEKEAQAFYKTHQDVKPKIEDDQFLNSLIESDLKNGITPVFVDGSHNKKNNQIGFGVIVILSLNPDKTWEFFEKLNAIEFAEYKESLNIAGEIFGVLKAIKNCVSKKILKMRIYYDYEGIEKWAIGVWKTNKPISMMYKCEIDNLIKTHNLKLFFQKVKAHTNVKYNNLVDQLAKKAVGIN
ncbi:MAG: ribonuclease H family protein [Malacoplasma sp.]|nr:ribonuclease H family protein [Malacoplasma sp.]